MILFLILEIFALEKLPNGRVALKLLGEGGCYTTDFYVKTGNLNYKICIDDSGFFVDSDNKRFTPNFGDWADTAKTIPKEYYKFENQAVVTEGKLSATLQGELDKTSLSAPQKQNVISGVKSGIGF